MGKLTKSLSASVAYHQERTEAIVEQMELLLMSQKLMLAQLEKDGLMPATNNKEQEK